MIEDTTIPPKSQMEVLACVLGPVSEETWLLEGLETSTQRRWKEIAVARSVVSPGSRKIPVRLLNRHDCSITIPKDTLLTTLEPLDTDPTATCVEARVSAQLCDEQEILWSMVEGAAKELSTGEKEQFFMLLSKYSQIFAYTNSDRGRTSKLQHNIHTGNTAPIRQGVRRMPHTRRAEVRKLVDEMLQQDVIQHSSSPWASPIVLVEKKDGSTRFCVDYRRLNEVTRKDAYPLPRIDMTLDTLAGSYWFSTLDLLSGYWQVEIAEEDRCKTAFCTTEGFYEFKVMPFGLCNAPATFQRLMDLVLAGLQWSQCLVYLDDIIIIGKTFEEHLQNLNAVFKRIQEAGLRLKPAKCTFFQEKVNYLGHIISREGVTPDAAKIEKVASWPIPHSAHSVQQFLGFANYYRRFIRDFSTIAKPLHRLTERGANSSQNEEQTSNGLMPVNRLSLSYAII